jgi:hypothetical protein
MLDIVTKSWKHWKTLVQKAPYMTYPSVRTLRQKDMSDSLKHHLHNLIWKT